MRGVIHQQSTSVTGHCGIVTPRANGDLYREGLSGSSRGLEWLGLILRSRTDTAQGREP